MGELIKLLTGTPIGNSLAWISALVLAAVCVYQWAEKYRQVRNSYDDVHKCVQENKKNIAELKEDKDKLQAQFDQRVKLLDQHDKDIDDKLDGIIKLVQELSEYQKNRDMHDFKDRILTQYKTYKQRKDSAGNVIITEREYETFTGLIDSYLGSGGNSFIHDDIVPAMRGWRVMSEHHFNALLSRLSRAES